MEPVHETVAMAKACEDAGFDAFWIAEAYPVRKHGFEARSSTAILAVIAAQTRRIQLGWALSLLTRAIRCRLRWKRAHAGSCRRRFLLARRLQDLYEEIGEVKAKSRPARHERKH